MEQINQIIRGDCIEEMKKLPENSVDAIITDPPYGLEFMGKDWDKFKEGKNIAGGNTGQDTPYARSKPTPAFYQLETTDMVNFQFFSMKWAIEAFRVLKPGGFLISFGGTRTYHRMACGIEDAGFEVRDMIEWVYGCLSEDTEILTPYGWERYHIYKHLNNQSPIMIYDIKNNIYKWEKPKRWSEYTLNKDTCYRIKSDTTDQLVSRNHRCLVEREGKLVFVKAEELQEMEYMPTLSNDFLNLEKLQSKILFKKMQWILQRIRMEEVGKDRSIKNKKQSKTLWRKESCLERGSNLLQNSWELFGSEVCPLSERVYVYGKEGWLCNGTPINNGKTSWKDITKSGSYTSQRPQSCKQPDRKLNFIQEQHRTQETRGYGITKAKVTKEKYSGIIFCPTISTGSFVARRKGKIFITGNSGFPKSLNIGKAVDKLQGNERKQFERNDGAGNKQDYLASDRTKSEAGVFGGDKKVFIDSKGTSEWEGWGTALKPAHEPIIVARKPLSEKTVAENCLKYGTGGINIDESRVKFEETKDVAHNPLYRYKNKDKYKQVTDNGQHEGVNVKFTNSLNPPSELGRFPANLIHDNSEEVRECFPESKSTASNKRIDEPNYLNKVYGKGMGGIVSEQNQHNDSGNASRFFKSIIYTAKAGKSERNMGCEELELKNNDVHNNPNRMFQAEAGVEMDKSTRGANQNNHPCVKPIALMEYLIKMVSREGQTILDPFMGSGTTAIACAKINRKFIGIEKCEDYIKIAEARIKPYLKQSKL